jgi:hypothetical protein
LNPDELHSHFIFLISLLVIFGLIERFSNDAVGKKVDERAFPKSNRNFIAQSLFETFNLFDSKTHSMSKSYLNLTLVYSSISNQMTKSKNRKCWNNKTINFRGYNEWYTCDILVLQYVWKTGVLRNLDCELRLAKQVANESCDSICHFCFVYVMIVEFETLKRANFTNLLLI